MTEFIQYVKDNSFLDLQKKPELLNDNNNLQALSLFIKSNPNIVKLNLAHCNIDSDKIKLLIDPINDSNITDLNIGSNKLGDEGAAEIAKLTKLITLYISCNSIGKEGAVEIAKLSNLTSLDIGNNSIGDVGTAELANKLLNLTYLNICENDLTSEGAAKIAKKLLKLTYLNICENDLTSEGAAKIAKKLLKLTNLEIGWNDDIGDVGVIEIAKLPCLTKLDIARCNLSCTGIEELANLINCDIDIDDQGQEIFLSLLKEVKKNNPTGNLTPENVKYIVFKIALQNDTCDIIKHIINHPEKYPLAINLRNEQGLLHFYNYSMKMKNFVSQKAIVPEPEQQKKTLLRLVQDNSITESDIQEFVGALTDMLSSCIPEKSSQRTLLIKALYNQIKEKNVNNLTQEELDQFVKNACHEAKSTEGFPVNHIQALRILSKFDFSEINENYSCINESLTKLYLKQQITFEHYHLQQEEGLHFYMVKVTGKNADMWIKYATDEKNASKEYKGDNVVTKRAYQGSMSFISSIDYYDQNDVWVAFVSDKQQDINNIDLTSIEMSITMMTSEHAHFTAHAGISRGVSYIGIPHKNISCMLHSFIATATLQHYGDCRDTLYTVNKDYMITAPIPIMRAILIKAFKGYDTDIFIGDNTTECSEETLEVLTKQLENMQKDDSDFNKTLLALTIKQQHESLKKAEITVPIKVTNEKGSNKCLNWVLQNKEGKVLNALNPQDMEAEYAWFFKSPWLWKYLHRTPIVTCDIKTLADLGHFNPPFEHEYQVETIGDVLVKI